MSIAIQKRRLTRKAFDPCSNNHFLNESQSYVYTRAKQILQDFESRFRKANSQNNPRELKTCLNSFYRMLKNNDILLNELSESPDSSSKKDLKDILVIRRASQTVAMLAEHLVFKKNSVLLSKKSADEFTRYSSDNRDSTLMIIKILKLFAMINSSFAATLSRWPTLTENLFELILQDKKVYFRNVLSLLEALIAANVSTITQDMFPIIQEILSNSPKKYFARFSRIIALLVLENFEKMDFQELYAGYQESKIEKINVFLLSLPNLLENYVLMIEHLQEIIRTLSSAKRESLPQVMAYLKESHLIKDSGLKLSFLKPLFEQCKISENLAAEVFTEKFMIKFIVKKSNIAEILFIISNLLASKRKVDIQNELNQLNFFARVLNPLFDLLFHPDLELENPEDIGGADAYGSPLTTARTQLSKIIVNFCDKDSQNIANKDLFISDQEREYLSIHIIRSALSSHYTDRDDTTSIYEDLPAIINKLSLEPNNPSDPFFTKQIISENAFENIEKKGLLNKMIDVLKKCQPDSTTYFWLTSCVESFLRGFHYTHQIFVAHTGLLYHLVNQVVNSLVSKQNNAQITYDLMGEIIKFNKYTIIFLENLCRTFIWDESLSKGVAKNIIDSNVFFRALILSFEKFNLLSEKEDDLSIKEKMLAFEDSSCLYSRFIKNGTDWFNYLVKAIEPSSLNQDNICCVNTALVTIIFADQKGLLGYYLSSLLTTNREKVQQTIENFNNVLTIWGKYYLSRTKDRFSLEHTTGINFWFFQDIQRKVQTFYRYAHSS